MYMKFGGMLLSNRNLVFLILCFSNIVYICLADECSNGYLVAVQGRSGCRASVLEARGKTRPHKAIGIKYSPKYDVSGELELMKYVQQETQTIGESNDDCNKAIRTEYCNFVELLGTCTIGSVLSIQMEFLPKMFATKMAEYHSFTTEAPNILLYAFHLVQAAEVLHRIEFVHGDLHPGNVGFNKEGALKVFDFSHSYLIRNQENRMTCCPLYAAPETFLFEEISERRMSDTWSVGAIIFLMFRGRVFIQDWMMKYESCERRSPGVTWLTYSTCSGRALYFASRLNRCSIADSDCANIYHEAEAKLEEKCKPNKSCLSKIEERVQNQLEFDDKLESLTKDTSGRARLAKIDTEDLTDLLINLLRFDYTARMQPKDAKSHKLFKQLVSDSE